MELKVGDKVKLNSGGPVMTVSELFFEQEEYLEHVYLFFLRKKYRSTKKVETVNCKWFIEQCDGPFTTNFHVDEITKCK